MNFTSKKRDVAAAPAASGERRRIGLIGHDERGNAYVDWRDAPADHERPVLEILGERKLSLKTEPDSYDPYARGRTSKDPLPPRAPQTRTDLRALSEHIKLMRALEERRRRGDEDADE